VKCAAFCATQKENFTLFSRDFLDPECGSKSVLKDGAQLIDIMSHGITQLVFIPWKDLSKTACKQCHITSHLPQKKTYPVTINSLVSCNTFFMFIISLNVLQY